MSEIISNPRPERPLSPAEIAQVMNPLFPLVDTVTTAHAVYYGRDNMVSARAVLDQRHKLPFDDPTRTETDPLANRVGYLRSKNKESNTFEAYYTPEEIMELSERLLWAEHNWLDPEFLAELDEEMAPHYELQKMYYEYSEDFRLIREDPVDEGNYERQDVDTEPINPPWDEVEDEAFELEIIAEKAQRASNAIRHFMLSGNNLNIHRHRYLLGISGLVNSDEEQAQKDIILQFIADSFAYEVVTKRESQKIARMAEICTRNVEIITNWYAENNWLINQIPDDFIFKRVSSRASYLSRLLSERPVKDQLRTMLSVMHARVNSSEPRGIIKGFQYDVADFYSFQRQICGLVDKTIRLLPEYEPGQELTVTPITPLE